jgi:hypothetical protein
MNMEDDDFFLPNEDTSPARTMRTSSPPFVLSFFITIHLILPQLSSRVRSLRILASSVFSILRVRGQTRKVDRSSLVYGVNGRRSGGEEKASIGDKKMNHHRTSEELNQGRPSEQDLDEDLALVDDEAPSENGTEYGEEYPSEFASEHASEDTEDDDDDEVRGEDGQDEDGHDPFWDDPPPGPKPGRPTLTFEDFVDDQRRAESALRAHRARDTEAFLRAEHDRLVAARERQAERTERERRATEATPRSTPKPVPVLWRPYVDQDAPKKKTALDVAWLPEPLKEMLALWDQRQHPMYGVFLHDPRWNGTQSSQAYQEFLNRPLCPWINHWATLPETFLLLEEIFCGEVAEWLERAQKVKVDHAPAEVIGGGYHHSLLKEARDLDRRMRTRAHLCDAMQSAQGRIYSNLHRQGDEKRLYKNELLSEPGYRNFQVVRSAVYQGTEHYRKHKKDYDAVRTRDPRTRAARRHRETDPKFKARDAERKRAARLKAKEDSAKAEADSTIIEDIITKV